MASEMVEYIKGNANLRCAKQGIIRFTQCIT